VVVVVVVVVVVHLLLVDAPFLSQRPLWVVLWVAAPPPAHLRLFQHLFHLLRQVHLLLPQP
jgi:hypothetical protein